MTIDETDIALIERLQLDGRRSFRALGRMSASPRPPWPRACSGSSAGASSESAPWRHGAKPAGRCRWAWVSTSPARIRQR
nr:AsnC family protein [Microbacterium sp. NIBRBAC000506063]